MSEERMSDDDYIEAIFRAAHEYCSPPQTLEVARILDRKLSDAIDAAMSHAYADGRSDERKEWLDKEMREATERAGSNLHPVFEDIVNQIFPKRAA